MVILWLFPADKTKTKVVMSHLVGDTGNSTITWSSTDLSSLIGRGNCSAQLLFLPPPCLPSFVALTTSNQQIVFCQDMSRQLLHQVKGDWVLGILSGYCRRVVQIVFIYGCKRYKLKAHWHSDSYWLRARTRKWRSDSQHTQGPRSAFHMSRKG